MNTEQQIPFDAKFYQEQSSPAIISTDGKAPMRDTETDQFVLIDLRNAPQGKDGGKDFMGHAIANNIEYMLISKDMDITNGFGYKGIRRGEEVAVGGDTKTSNRFNLNSFVSREHFSVRLDKDGQVYVKDTASTNGTRVYAKEAVNFSEPAGANESNDNYWSYEESQKREQARKREEQAKATPPPNNDAADSNPMSRVTDQFPEINVEDAAKIMYDIEQMEKDGVDPKQMKRSLYMQWHPDRAPQGTAESRRLHSASQLIGELLKDK
jgi:hypothetical protein